MKKFVDQQKHRLNKKSNGFILFLHWLASLLKLTDEERDAAGIYSGNQYGSDDSTSKEK